MSLGNCVFRDLAALGKEIKSDLAFVKATGSIIELVSGRAKAEERLEAIRSDFQHQADAMRYWINNRQSTESPSGLDGRPEIYRELAAKSAHKREQVRCLW